jgi:chemotaxis protein MotB
MKNLLISLSALFLMSSCVSSKMYNELEAKKKECDARSEELSAGNLALTTRNAELENMLNDLRGSANELAADTARLGTDIRNLRADYNKMVGRYDEMMKTNVDGTINSEAARQLIRDLQKTRESLILREDELRKKEAALNQKSARVVELERMLNAKDSTMQALKNNLVNALIGYKDKGMTVEMKNGKVYVMLEERLLFATGSTVVDPKGVEALRELGKVLEKNPDINVLIEGHTDNVPMKGTGEIKDNWDLSVMRATSVVKILLNSKISPVRITAAGRGEFVPIENNDTAESRKKNRRIEVILTPKLDEILKVLETN